MATHKYIWGNLSDERTEYENTNRQNQKEIIKWLSHGTFECSRIAGPRTLERPQPPKKCTFTLTMIISKENMEEACNQMQRGPLWNFVGLEGLPAKHFRWHPLSFLSISQNLLWEKGIRSKQRLETWIQWMEANSWKQEFPNVSKIKSQTDGVFLSESLQDYFGQKGQLGSVDALAHEEWPRSLIAGKIQLVEGCCNISVDMTTGWLIWPQSASNWDSEMSFAEYLWIPIIPIIRNVRPIGLSPRFKKMVCMSDCLQREETGKKQVDSFCFSFSALTSRFVFRSLGDRLWHHFHRGGCSPTCRSYLAFLTFCSWQGLWFYHGCIQCAATNRHAFHFVTSATSQNHVTEIYLERADERRVEKRRGEQRIRQ